MIPRVLVVESEKSVRKLLRKASIKKKQRPLEAAGKSGVPPLLKLGEIEFAFVDVNLNPNPQSLDEKEGLEVIKLLRDKDPDIFICAMSGWPVNKDLALEAGADVFLEKPFNISTVLSLLGSVFEEGADPSS